MHTILTFIFLFYSLSAFGRPEFQEKFGSWLAFHEKVSPTLKTCFIASEPIEKNSQDQYRSPPYIIFNKIAQHSYEFMVYSGYRLNDTPVELIIDNTYKFKLGPLEMEAWPFNDITDKEIIKYAPKGKQLVIKAINFRKQQVIDTYSLDGLFRALNFLEETCK
jgi:hypothetical protein